jgi:toluene monooxygenase system ferredoxin subunit
MTSFVRAVSVKDLWVGEMRAVDVSGQRVLLVNVDGQVRAYLDRCPHRGLPLSEGRLEGAVLVCSQHGWQFDARTGGGVNPACAALTPIPARVEGDDVLVAAPEKAPRSVGPVLALGEEARAVVTAILAENPGARVLDRGGYLRVVAERRCSVTRASIERALGRDFRLPSDLERIMVSFAGRISITDDSTLWEDAR